MGRVENKQTNNSLLGKAGMAGKEKESLQLKGYSFPANTCDSCIPHINPCRFLMKIEKMQDK